MRGAKTCGPRNATASSPEGEILMVISSARFFLHFSRAEHCRDEQSRASQTPLRSRGSLHLSTLVCRSRERKIYREVA